MLGNHRQNLNDYCNALPCGISASSKQGIISSFKASMNSSALSSHMAP